MTIHESSAGGNPGSDFSDLDRQTETDQPQQPPPKPTPLSVNPDGIPDLLKQCPQWVVWRYEFRNGKWTKPPCDARTGRHADTTRPDTWCSFEEAFAAYRAGGWDGIGFVPKPEDCLVGIDLDHCRDPLTGHIRPWAQSIVDDLATHTEVSVSGTGLRLFAFSQRPDSEHTKKGHVEIYDGRTKQGKPGGRYLTLTGHPLAGTPATIENRSEAVADFYFSVFTVKATSSGTLSDDELIEKARQAANGARFRQLWDGDTSGYPSISEADQSLCNRLAFWTAKNPERMDRLYRRSGLYTKRQQDPSGNKWERKDYRDRTIDNALEWVTKVYGDKFSSNGTDHAPGGNQSHNGAGWQTPEPSLNWLKSSELRTNPERYWLWKGCIASGGISLLSAYWKCGKTTLLAYLLKALDTGSSFCELPTSKTHVLYVTEESQGRWAVRRDRLVLGDHIEFLVRPFLGKPSWDEWRAFLRALESKVRECESGLVVFDTLSNLWPVTKENDASQVQAALMPLHAITEYAALVLSHHLRKADGEEATGSRGSGALTSFVDTIIEMRRYNPKDKADRKRKLTGYGRDDETADHVGELVIELTDQGYLRVGSQAEAEIRDLTGPIQAVLPGDPPGSDWETVWKSVKENWPEGQQTPGQHRVREALNQGAEDDSPKWNRQGQGSRGQPFTYFRRQAT